MQLQSKLPPKAITHRIAKPSIENQYKAWQWSQILYIIGKASYTSTKDTQAQISYSALQIYAITYATLNSSGGQDVNFSGRATI